MLPSQGFLTKTTHFLKDEERPVDYVDSIEYVD